MKKNNKITAIIIGCTLLLAGALAYFHFHHHSSEESESEFLVTNPWHDNVIIKEKYVAQIKAVQHIELRSLEKGYLQNIFVDEGQLVHKGDKMFQIMPLLLEAELKKAKAEYQLAKIEYDNTAILQKKGVVSMNELLLAQAKLDKAEAEMELAQAHVEFTTIKAPFDGIMDRFHVRLGSLVDEGELLTTISDNSKMWLYFNVSEADYLDYMQKKKTDDKMIVELVLANGALFSHSGEVDTIEADFNNEVGNVAFRATFPNPELLLRHGETGTVLLTKKYDNALIIPQKATFEILDKKFVYVVNEKNEVVSRQITIAAEIAHLFIISAGLTDTDRILLEGLGKVRPGEVIQTVMQSRADVEKSLKLSTK